jgi:hypothetical protein
VELQADGAGGDVHLLRGQRDAGGVHDGEKKLELPKVNSRLLERDRLILLNARPRGTLRKRALSTAVSAADS